jgi:hypothetical protein
MGQGEVLSILDEYIMLRGLGVDSNSALQPLRKRVDKLKADDKTELVRLVKAWESRGSVAPEPPSDPPTKPKPGTSTLAKTEHGVIRKISPLKNDSAPPQTPDPDSTRPVRTPTTLPSPKFAVPPPSRADQFVPPQPPKEQYPWLVTQIECPRCRKANPSNEIFCSFCGYFLQETSTAHGTVKLEPEPEADRRPDYFGGEMTLILFIRHNKNQFKIKPQGFGREVIVGRSDGGTLNPDIDLSSQNGGQLGVSRLHLSLQYSAEHNTLSAMDMRSANGSFVNGQRLHANEVRVLRHGDELRIGHLVLSVYFQRDTLPG